MIVIIINI